MDSSSGFLENHWSTLTGLKPSNSLAYIVQNDIGFDNINYTDFFSTVKQTLSAIQKHGIRAKEYIPLYSLNDINTIKAVFALWLNGSIPVMINSTLTSTEQSNILSQFDFDFVLSHSHLPESISDRHIKTIILDKLKHTSKDFNSIGTNDFNIEDDALVIFTSGSSSTPKGVVHKFKSLLKSYELGNKYFNYSQQDKWLLTLPIFHIGGFQILLRSFLSGASVIIPKSQNIKDLQISIESQNPNYISLVSTQFKRLLEADTKAPYNNHVLLGGGRIETELIYEGIKKGWNPYKVYGSSETAAFISVLDIKNFNKFNNSAGELLGEVKVEILYDENDKSSGEIVIKSPTLFDRYLNDEIETSKRLKNGKYHAGDFGYMMDDLLFIVNRRTDLIISGGENINPNEIEEVLLNHPKIKEVCVLGIKDEEWGEIVCAVIVPMDEIDISENEIKNFLKSNLTGYKIPKKIFFLDALPKTELGKVKRSELLSLLQNLNQ
jgi:O-succinylbenzoic acid--CoA ligase